METHWATVDGVHLELPSDCTVTQLREELHKPADAVLVAVTGDLVSVVHDDDQPLSDLIAGCADTYYFWRAAEPTRNEILAAPELEHAVETAADNAAGERDTETTFQRPGIDN
ncbi:uncharacterized protein Nmag_0740 [Natrialba magadii ATCC 43099]|uniref:Uncharacterized protein n=1 Tax=Natrialba magadii (strain ATCC 43099 / DSM 3394 / CCM 3739 / CIP 104546 / IAM 13178 / JCM 8861 / NBRC 102185 / NCIMB 2190 / MS3) TaxID=547559 RepID=D3SZJ1_NATMM|nr:hypothetical protein [Natrialba magadii]ADD04325.1 uncharacterized protein Nmag_0740 [Natrialba magadii ATCC 43099]ELY26727.1 hypothetical protein C500_16240 [Natrialba magadii ATCC 43099]